MARGYDATAVDGWARITHPWFRIEAEWAALFATIQQASLVPGVLYREPVTGQQMGAALESEFGPEDSIFAAGLDAGYASGDPSPGFGANVERQLRAREAGGSERGQGRPALSHDGEQLPASTPTTSSTASSFARSSAR